MDILINFVLFQSEIFEWNLEPTSRQLKLFVLFVSIRWTLIDLTTNQTFVVFPICFNQNLPTSKLWDDDGDDGGFTEDGCWGDSTEDWSSKKKSWCCENYQKGCSTYDCYLAIQKPESMVYFLQCDVVTSLASSEFHNKKHWGDYMQDQMDDHWSYAKRAYCCIKEQKGCAGG